MNKKLIRLTESDLHRIVKESVNKILLEAINELDPRTYASYADKRMAQGQNDKAYKGMNAAINSWNKKYGTKFVDYDSPRTLKYGKRDLNDVQFDDSIPLVTTRNNVYMGSNPESIEPNYNLNYYYDIYDEIHPVDGVMPSTFTDNEYYDLKNGIGKTVLSSNEFPSSWKKRNGSTDLNFGFKGIPNKIKDKVSHEGIRTAKEMQHGNGKYIKGKGWQ